jgi:cell division septal protein FtsQ
MRKIIELLGPEKIKRLAKLYKKHSNFYIDLGQIMKFIKENPEKKRRPCVKIISLAG